MNCNNKMNEKYELISLDTLLSNDEKKKKNE